MGERSTMRAVEEMYDAARDEAGSDSDADTLVEFRGPATFDRYMDLKILLEELLGYQSCLMQDEHEVALTGTTSYAQQAGSAESLHPSLSTANRQYLLVHAWCGKHECVSR